jgi:hypothetical protein
MDNLRWWLKYWIPFLKKKFFIESILSDDDLKKCAFVVYQIYQKYNNNNNNNNNANDENKKREIYLFYFSSYS